MLLFGDPVQCSPVTKLIFRLFFLACFHGVVREVDGAGCTEGMILRTSELCPCTELDPPERHLMRFPSL